MEVVQHGADWQDAVGVAHDGFDDVHAGHADGVVGSALAVDDLVGGVLDFLVDLLTHFGVQRIVARQRVQSHIGTPPMVAEAHSGTSESPCSPAM